MTVLSEELDSIERARSRAMVPPGRRDGGEEPILFTDAAGADLKRAGDANLFGLALSGGGIRSATFNLGVIQALAEFGLLRRIDYLSTVSGGGYIGAWLTALIRRRGGVEKAEKILASSARGQAPDAYEESAITFLREHSNYLTPRVGVLGADTWTAVSTYVRNLTLNLTVLVLVLFGLLQVPWLLLELFGWIAGPSPTALPDAPASGGMSTAVFMRDHLGDWLAVGFLTIAVVASGLSLRFVRGAAVKPGTWRYWISRQSTVLQLVILPAMLGAFCLAASMLGGFAVAWPDFFLLMVPYLALWLLLIVTSQPWKSVAAGSGSTVVPRAKAIVSAVGAAALAALIVKGISAFDWAEAPPHVWMTFGVPAVVAVFTLSAVLELGLMGRHVSEEVREWWSRLGGWFLIFSIGWIGFCGVALWSAKAVAEAGTLTVPTATAGWLLTTIAGVLSGKSAGTGGKTENRWLSIIGTIAPYVFVAGLLVALSAGGERVLDLAKERFADTFGVGLFVPWDLRLVAAGLSAALALLLSASVDVNTFSLQPLYRNRLVRCYLGASRGPDQPDRRQPHPFTGFDPGDDIALADLAESPTARPYPLINVAMNLVKGKELAWQERKAASFTLAPLHCGFGKAYRRTDEYAEGQLTLGEAFATSGAAASPNMGYHSNPALAFLMTVFNVRLGMWLGNPNGGRRNRHWRKSSPVFGLKALLDELFGNTNEEQNFVYLSDGGHFDNLGIYELLRRRCRFIIACDASADPQSHFDDLGSAIRKCRTDFGIDVTLDTSPLVPDPNSGRSSYHCAVAHVRYGDGTSGTLLYLKASLTGREAVDVLNYAASNRGFPHQSTADQWFGESQFESYRRLGYLAAHTVFEAAVRSKAGKPGKPLESIFTALRERWYPPTGLAPAAFLGVAQSLDGLNERLRSNPYLSYLDAQIFPGWPQLMHGSRPSTKTNLWLPEDANARRAGFYFCCSLIQLMEEVYVDLGLELNHGHPDNRGWMNLFRHWSWCGMLRVTWSLTAATYGARFQTFCRDRLDLEIGSVAVNRIEADADGRYSQLNFLEQEYVRDFGTDGEVYAIQLEVENPADRRAGIFFTVGFAVVKGDQLLGLRIQDHLRKMGLARLAVDHLISRQGVRKLAPPPGLRQGERAPSEADETSLQRIFSSVALERARDVTGEPSDGAVKNTRRAALAAPALQ